MIDLTHNQVATILGEPYVIGTANGNNADARFDTPRAVAISRTSKLYILDKQ